MSSPINPENRTHWQNQAQTTKLQKRMGEAEKVKTAKQEVQTEGVEASKETEALAAAPLITQSTLESLAELKQDMLVLIDAENPELEPPKEDFKTTNTPGNDRTAMLANIAKKWGAPVDSLSGVLFLSLLEQYLTQMRTALTEAEWKLEQRVLTKEMGDTKAKLAIDLAEQQRLELMTQAIGSFVNAGIGVIQLATPTFAKAQKKVDEDITKLKAEADRLDQKSLTASPNLTLEQRRKDDPNLDKAFKQWEKKVANRDDLINQEYQLLSRIENTQFEVLKSTAKGTTDMVTAGIKSLQGAIQALQEIARTNSELIQQNVSAADEGKRNAKDIMRKILEDLQRMDDLISRVKLGGSGG